MRAVLQRVERAEVRVDGHVVGAVGRGWLILLGVAEGDTPADAERIAAKILGLRGFADADGKINLDVREAGGGVLLVSQFTLLGDCRKGRRPSFAAAARPEAAEALYEDVGRRIEAAGVAVGRGVFGAMMAVELVNDGPVTLLLDSRGAF